MTLLRAPNPAEAETEYMHISADDFFDFEDNSDPIVVSEVNGSRIGDHMWGTHIAYRR